MLTHWSGDTFRLKVSCGVERHQFGCGTQSSTQEALMRYWIGLIVASFLMSFWLSPALFAALGWIFQLPGDIRVYAHSLASARWIGFVQWLLVGIALMPPHDHRLIVRRDLLRWGTMGLLSTLFWTTYLILIDRWLLFEARIVNPPISFREYFSIYTISLLEQLCYMLDRFSYSFGLRVIYCSLYWEWRFGGPVPHMIWLLWNLCVVALFHLCFRVALIFYRWITRRRWSGRHFPPILSGWLAFYLSVPLVELAQLEWRSLLVGIITTTVYDSIIFLVWCMIWFVMFENRLNKAVLSQ